MRCLTLYEFELVALLEISTFGDWGVLMIMMSGVLCGWGIWWRHII
jgi:hypothetical protein